MLDEVFVGRASDYELWILDDFKEAKLRGRLGKKAAANGGGRDSPGLEELARPSSKARMGRDADSGARMVSGHAEEG